MMIFSLFEIIPFEYLSIHTLLNTYLFVLKDEEPKKLSSTTFRLRAFDNTVLMRTLMGRSP